MKILRYIHVVLALAFYRWVMRELDPMHPDLPRVLRRQMELADLQKQLFA